MCSWSWMEFRWLLELRCIFHCWRKKKMVPECVGSGRFFYRFYDRSHVSNKATILTGQCSECPQGYRRHTLFFRYYHYRYVYDDIIKLFSSRRSLLFLRFNVQFGETVVWGENLWCKLWSILAGLKFAQVFSSFGRKMMYFRCLLTNGGGIDWKQKHLLHCVWGP